MELNLEELRELDQCVSSIAKNLLSLAPTLKLLKAVGDKCVAPPVSDRLLRSGDAANYLGVSPSSITVLVESGLLTPYYVPTSNQRRFKLSELEALAKTQPWANSEECHE